MDVTELGLMEIAMYRLLEIWSNDSQFTTTEQLIKYANKQKYSEKTYENMKKTINQLIDKGLAEKDIHRSMIVPIKETPKEQADSKQSVEELFESVWKLYPIKRGKGQVAHASKKKLHSIGYDEISRAISRYVKETKDTGKEQFMVIGSTFFNSRYVDYLDKNFVELKPMEGAYQNDRRPSQAKPESAGKYKYLD